MPPHFADKPSRARRVPGKQAKACGACSLRAYGPSRPMRFDFMAVPRLRHMENDPQLLTSPLLREHFHQIEFIEPALGREVEGHN